MNVKIDEDENNKIKERILAKQSKEDLKQAHFIIVNNDWMFLTKKKKLLLKKMRFVMIKD